MSTVARSLVIAIESVWDVVRARHPDVPDVVVAVASGSAGRKGLRLGHFGPDRWELHGRPRMPELFVGGEGLAYGPRDILATLLHEAAHGAARTRQVNDTSRAGAYHNSRYRDIATELGLAVTRDPGKGWAVTVVTDATALQYQTELDLLASAVIGHRRSEHDTADSDIDPASEESGDDEDTERAPRNGRALLCGCTPARRVRAHKRTIDAGPILCGICKEPFSIRTTKPVDA